MLYKTEHNKTQQKQQISQSLSKNDILKATMPQRHSNYHGFVKTGFETRRPKGASAIRFFQHFGTTWSILVPFLNYRISKGVPKSTILFFLRKLEKGGPRNGFEKT